ncbi:MAG: hypothetical protein K0R67_1016 [Paenibacillus sp.]|nr:hypothetical protein [Paenibacillus sp.]
MKYNGLFWGFLFFFDFRLGGMDILPDTIGYVLMAIAFTNLDAEGTYFQKGKRMSIILAVLSIFDFFQFAGPTSTTSSMFTVLSLVIWLMNAKLVQLICNGIASQARDNDFSVLEEKALFRWKLYRVIVITTPMLMVFSLFAVQLVGLLLIPIFLYTIVVLAMMMGLMKQAESTLPRLEQGSLNPLTGLRLSCFFGCLYPGLDCTGIFRWGCPCCFLECFREIMDTVVPELTRDFGEITVIFPDELLRTVQSHLGERIHNRAAGFFLELILQTGFGYVERFAELLKRYILLLMTFQIVENLLSEQMTALFFCCRRELMLVGGFFEGTKFISAQQPNEKGRQIVLHQLFTAWRSLLFS